MKKNEGFTLVELAVVLTIIGIIIGGVLKAGALTMSARITATIREYESLSTAAISFRNKYGQIPGDISTATENLSGCGGLTASGNWCTDGDGDGKIGALPTSGADSIANKDQSGTLNMPELETVLFFKHLALADLISGIDPGAHPVNDIATGETHPKAAVGGAFTALYSRNHPNRRWPSGHVLRLQNSPQGAQRPVGEDVIAGRHAWILDRKIDDAIPYSGIVAGSHGGLNGDNPDSYLTSPHNSSKDWMLYFELDGD